MPTAPRVRLAVRQLAEFLLRSGDIDSRFAGFDRALEGARIHRRLQKAAGAGYAAEVALQYDCTADGVDYRLEGRADGIFTDADGLVTIDEIKTTELPASQITEDGNPCHWAQGMLYAAIYGRQQGLERLAVRLTYYQMDEERAIYFVRAFALAELTAFLQQLLARYAPWARRARLHAQRRAETLAGLAFPYPAWRPGQHAMAGAVYRACQAESPAQGGCLLCQAPTGIGKTMSTLYPALKAMGEGKGEKLFYLTARTTARAAAEEALARLQALPAPPTLRSITLTAKEKACLCPNAEGRPECLPQRCPYAKGYYDRLRTALEAALDSPAAWTREALAQLGQAHRVCPFELGLDLAEWCDVIIGDYNYLFDPVVRLRRFFERRGDWLFLIDEAHNLPERAREMYSARFAKSALLEAKRALGKDKSRLAAALTKANAALVAYRKAVAGRPEADAPPEQTAEQTSLFAPAQPAPAAPTAAPAPLFDGQPLFCQPGVRFVTEPPAGLLAALRRVLPAAQAWLDDHREGQAHAAVLELYFALKDFLRTAEGYDSHYVTQLVARGSELTVTLLCLDPAPFVEKSLACGRAAVLFSATITPPGYYKAVLGCPQAQAIALPSPFPPERLGLYCLSGISTRYRDRDASVAPIVQALAQLFFAKKGNYLAFFPSYAYLQQVYQAFSARWPDVPVAVQQSGQDEAARAALLARFSAGGQPLLGFCVLGGVFGEGIDLVGDRLIGCAVVGVGLPQVSPRQEMLRRYYDQTAGCGFAYAYQYPGMNKVLQAAGRVIRTPQDQGVVVLIDDRFAREDYRRLLPPHWGGLRYLPDADALGGALADFWVGQADGSPQND